MWVKCHECNSTGFKNTITKFNYRMINNIHDIDIFDTIECKEACELCNNDSIDIIDNLMIGYIYVDDHYDPITPPTSPR